MIAIADPDSFARSLGDVILFLYLCRLPGVVVSTGVANELFPVFFFRKRRYPWKVGGILTLPDAPQGRGQWDTGTCQPWINRARRAISADYEHATAGVSLLRVERNCHLGSP